MERKAASGIMLALLLTSMLTLAFNIQSVKATGTIYIRADGSIDPPTAPISSVDNVTYAFTDNIYDSIVVERDNIIVDGASYTLQGPGPGSGCGITLTRRSNVTIKTVTIKGFSCGLWLDRSSNNTVLGNDMTHNMFGIELYSSSNNNSIFENNMTANTHDGILFWGYCSSNSIFRNNMSTNDGVGIFLGEFSNLNSISGNVITTNNQHGIMLQDSYYNNVFGNDLTANKFEGIALTSIHGAGSSYNTISRNHITKNYLGIDLNQEGVSYNRIFENNVTANTYGIYFFLASNNVVYHNNFINNTQQVLAPSVNVWDDGYPSGGNYWSDYTGVDLHSGPNQDHPGSDGIGDITYVLDEYNRDRYPLMKPFGTPIQGDVNRDGIVDINDVIIWAKAFGSKPRDANWNPYVDLYHDNIIGIFDGIMICMNFGKTYP